MGSVNRREYSLFLRQCGLNDLVREPIQGHLEAGAEEEIPRWLKGVLYRVGYGLHAHGDVELKHPFDTLAVIHAIEINNGKARYRSRPVEGQYYSKVVEKGPFSAPDPCSSILGRFMSWFDYWEASDNCGVNAYFHGDDLYAATETNLIRRIDPSDLATDPEAVDCLKSMAVHKMSAHPHFLADGSLLNIGTSINMKGSTVYNVLKFPPQGHDEAEIIGQLEAKSKLHPSYFHSFGLTENFIVFIEQSMTMNMKKLLAMNLLNIPIVECFDWWPQQKTFIHLIDLKTGRKRSMSYMTRPLACFHHINAYEEDEHVIVDIVATDGMVYKKLMYDVLKDGTSNLPPAKPIRFVLPLICTENSRRDENLVRLRDTKCKAFKWSKTIIRAEEEPLAGSEIAYEMPRINYDFNKKKYGFVYGIGMDPKNEVSCKLIKNDLQAKTVRHIESAEEQFCEPVFVPRPGSVEEDDGVVLSMVFKDLDPKFAALLIVDGKTFKEMARIGFRSSGPIAGTLHGSFMPNNTSNKIFT